MSLLNKIDKNKVPSHVAIIMDGNGRWARERGMPRVYGHQNGAKAVRAATEAAAELGVKYLTLYAFSTENWNRPKIEIEALMSLLVSTIEAETKTLVDNKIRLQTIGNISSLPESVQSKIAKLVERTKDFTGLTLVVALSYSSKWEITEALKALVKDCNSGKIDVNSIDHCTIDTYLTTAGMPEPELLIRTSGEYRLSNFLLWQIAYTELYFTNTLWPDFGKEDFYKAIESFQQRERRFGKTSEQL
jgi:undecaprenyl diphosphate synthase